MTKKFITPKIEPVFPLPDFPYFTIFWESIECLVEELIGKLQGTQEWSLKELHTKLDEAVPIVTWFPQQKLPGLIPVSLLTRSHERFSNGTGRYFVDVINRFALPGHYLSIESSMTVDFYFADRPDRKFGLSHIGLLVKTPEEWAALEENLPKVAEEIRITVRAVYEARRIVSLKQLKEGEKALLLREKFTSLWERDTKGFDLNLFDQVQQWLIKAKAEENSTKLWKEILPHIGKEEKISFDRDMFLEIQTLLFAYRDDFIAERKLTDLARLACYQYFFKKKLQQDLHKEPFKRHIYLKVFKIDEQRIADESKDLFLNHSLGISIGVNLLNRYELLDVNHILAAIHAFVPDLELIPNSYFVDARHEAMRFYYLEVTKERSAKILETEFQLLKTKLAHELGERIEIVNHPLFLPSNEEELLKYVAILSKELNKEDIPQVVISFDRQAQDVFSFHVVVLRHVLHDSSSIRELLEKVCPTYRWIEEQVKCIKASKGNSSKEATIIKAVLPKLLFFRKDFSLDLGKARTTIGAILLEAIGEYRDYNGGTYQVQHHSFNSFKEGFPESEESLLERYFYSIEPAFMRMVLDTAFLKEGYKLFKEVVSKEFGSYPFVSEHTKMIPGVVIAIASPFLKSTDVLFQELFSLSHRFPSIAYCPFWVGRIFTFVLYYSSPDTEKQEECLKEIERMLEEKRNLLSVT